LRPGNEYGDWTLSDIFSEVDEEVRRDELKVIWDRYGVYMIAVCVAVILGVGGFKGWQAYQVSQAHDNGARYAEALELSRTGKPDAALKLFTQIRDSGPAGYAALASFQVAAAEAKAGRSDQAVKIYDRLAARSGLDGTLRDLARVKAGFILLDHGKPGDVKKRVGDLNKPDNPWRNSAREILALDAFKRGDMKQASTLFGAVLAERAAPPGMRRRAQVMLSVILPKLAATGGGAPNPAKPGKAEPNKAKPK
jgi:hypothetical protein